VTESLTISGFPPTRQATTAAPPPWPPGSCSRLPRCGRKGRTHPAPRDHRDVAALSEEVYSGAASFSRAGRSGRSPTTSSCRLAVRASLKREKASKRDGGPCDRVQPSTIASRKASGATPQPGRARSSRTLARGPSEPAAAPPVVNLSEPWAGGGRERARAASPLAVLRDARVFSKPTGERNLRIPSRRRRLWPWGPPSPSRAPRAPPERISPPDGPPARRPCRPSSGYATTSGSELLGRRRAKRQQEPERVAWGASSSPHPQRPAARASRCSRCGEAQEGVLESARALLAQRVWRTPFSSPPCRRS